MKQLLITTHLYTFAVICVIATTISSCTFKKKTDMETLTGTKENELTMLVGTYTSGDSKGIYSFRFNEETGTATALSETEVENPSYLAVSADGKFIYTVSEFNNEQAAANAFAFNQEKGTLKLLNSQKTGGECDNRQLQRRQYLCFSYRKRRFTPACFRYYKVRRFGNR